MNGNLVNADTGKTLMIAQRVKLYIPQFTHYEIKHDKETSAKDYIMGYNKKDTPFEIRRLSPQYTDNREILDSLLHLNFNIVNNFKYSRERQYKEIVKWCQKYGLPFQKGIEAIVINNTPVIFRAIKSPYAEQGYCAFSAEIFCNELASLYNNFLYVLACKPDLYIGIGRESLHDKLIYNIKSSATVEKIQGMLLQYFKEIKFQMDIEFDGERYSLIPTFDNLIELAKYQLLLLYNADTTTGIKECKCCGELFSCTHRAQEFCSRCSPQKYYQRKKRAKQKEGAKNG
ncbi:MAG: hypothetical protein IKM33_03215 [Clostridia bacterium]|nr:hypothetical protein [Clostridia bacterium]